MGKTNAMLEKVMLIDDDQFVLMMNELLLRSSEFAKSITTVMGVNEAIAHLELISRNTTNLTFPDVIFLDLDMPDKTGWDFLDEVAMAYPEFQQLSKVIILSSSIIDLHYEKAKHYPAVIALVPKPLKLESLLEFKKLAFFERFF